MNLCYVVPSSGEFSSMVPRYGTEIKFHCGSDSVVSDSLRQNKSRIDKLRTKQLGTGITTDGRVGCSPPLLILSDIYRIYDLSLHERYCEHFLEITLHVFIDMLCIYVNTSGFR